jgi:TfoX/Sxy family transcriptional regulator of competence genes
MSFDEALATRVRRVLAPRSDVTERRMFGGICFLVGGSMACGIVKAELCVRVRPGRHEEALSAPQTRPMDFTGRPMRGFVYVGAAGLADSAALRKWVTLGI